MFDPFIFVTAITFLVLITVLVAAHELGHYLFARLFGMGVEEFAIGFGRKPLWTWMRKRYRVDPRRETRLDGQAADGSDSSEHEYETTTFTIRPWPLGGFVKIKGMVPEEDGSEVNIPGGFYSKAAWQRWVVLFMGPMFSVIAGLMLVVPVLMYVGLEPSGRAVLRYAKPGSPADRAGLRSGDRFLSVDGKTISKWEDMSKAVRDHGPSPLQFEIDRSGRRFFVSIAPELSQDKIPVLDDKQKPTGEMKHYWMIGASAELKKYEFGEAISTAAMMPLKMVAGLAGIVAQPSQFKDQMGGPVAIVQATDAATRRGLAEVVWIAGLLSMSVGILNLLPISPLDGGQMMVAFVEMLRRGRRLSFRVQNWVAGVGLVMIFMLIVGVFAADIGRLLPKAEEKPVPVKGK